MTAKATTKTDKNPAHESPREDWENQLDRELADGFPASDA
jgi:hypothetical protein